jgi:RNA polymerase-binding transcription factor DksA
MDTETYAKRLEEEKAKLESELSSVGRKNPANPADWEAIPSETGQEADRVDAADLIEGYASNDAILTELEARHSSVLDALARIGAGTYGVCTVGGEAIEAERLDADPAAATCITHRN